MLPDIATSALIGARAGLADAGVRDTRGLGGFGERAVGAHHHQTAILVLLHLDNTLALGALLALHGSHLFLLIKHPALDGLELTGEVLGNSAETGAELLLTLAVGRPLLLHTILDEDDRLAAGIHLGDLDRLLRLLGSLLASLGLHLDRLHGLFTLGLDQGIGDLHPAHLVEIELTHQQLGILAAGGYHSGEQILIGDLVLALQDTGTRFEALADQATTLDSLLDDVLPVVLAQLDGRVSQLGADEREHIRRVELVGLDSVGHHYLGGLVTLDVGDGIVALLESLDEVGRVEHIHI